MASTNIDDVKLVRFLGIDYEKAWEESEDRCTDLEDKLKVALRQLECKYMHPFQYTDFHCNKCGFFRAGTIERQIIKIENIKAK